MHFPVFALLESCLFFRRISEVFAFSPLDLRVGMVIKYPVRSFVLLGFTIIHYIITLTFVP